MQAGKMQKQDYERWCEKAKIAREELADGKITLAEFVERLKED